MIGQNIEMTDPSHKLQNSKLESSQDSHSFLLEYPGEVLQHFPSFAKLQLNKIIPSTNDINSNRKKRSKTELEGFFTNDTLPNRMGETSDRSQRGSAMTPQKYHRTERSHLGANSVLYSPCDVNYSPRPSLNNDRQLYERRIRHMTKEWAIQKSAMKKQIKQLEFIIQQWKQLEQRKYLSNDKTQMSQSILKDVGSPIQSLELMQLKKKLEIYEAEKQQMGRDIIQLENELKKTRSIGNFNNRQLGYVRKFEFSENSDTLNHAKELETFKDEYQRIILDKDCRYQELLTDFTRLQEQLQRQRRQTVILLQKRTNELQSNLTILKVTNDNINSDLRNAIDRLKQELQQEKNKSKNYENELIFKDHTLKLMENNIALSKKSFEELRETYMNKCIQLQRTRSEPNRNNTYIRYDAICQTAKQQLCTMDFWAQVNIEDPSMINQWSAMISNYKEQNEKLKRRHDQLEQILAEKQHSIRSLVACNSQLDALARKFESSYNNTLRQKAIIQSKLLKQTTERQTLELRVARGLADGNSKQLTDIRLERSMNKKQIELLKSELDECRRKIDTFRSYEQHDKLNISSQDRITHNYHQITIHNLIGQLNSSKIKLEGIEARLEIKKRELKQKDDFIRNTIVSRLGKQTFEPQVEYLIRKMDEFIDAHRLKEHL